MLNLKGVINQLKEEEYRRISKKLLDSKAEKFNSMFQYYRENSMSDEDIQTTLNLTSNAFYVLKSRLFEKIQEQLLERSVDPKTDILKKLIMIPQLLFDTNRSISHAALTKLEKDLSANDMPYELKAVYAALKKIHPHTDKYYEYTQLYNKHVAYTLALDKSETLLLEFTKNLGNYCASRDPGLLSIFSLIKKEIANVSCLYASHHLKVTQNILDVSFAVFLPLEEAALNDDPVEDVLSETEKIISQYPKDAHYQYILNIINFLSYEYYQKSGSHKKAGQYFSLVNIHLPSFLYYNHCCFCSKFLISKVERYMYLNIESRLYEENKICFKNYEPDKSDIPNYINYIKYLAVSAYYADKYDEASKLLSNLLNAVSFKSITYSEIEIKLFLALTYSMANKYDLAWIKLRSVSRKINSENRDGSYQNAVLFAALLKTQGTPKGKVHEKLNTIKTQFNLLNQGPKKMLEFIKLDEKFIMKLGKPVK